MIDVAWLARSEQDLPTGTAWLSAWEAARLDRMRYTKRRVEYLTSRLTAKHAMAALLGAPRDPAARFEVRHRRGGAPAPHVDDAPAPLSISMTDRAGWAATVVSHDRTAALGCDMELVEPRSDGFVRDWFTTSEQDLVAASADDDEWMLRANLVWSAKESALKVLTTGLRRDTRSVEVTLTGGDGDGWSRLEVADLEDGRRIMPGWWRRLGVFVLTVAADSDLAAPRDLDGSTLRLAAGEPVHSWLDAPITPD